MSLDTYGELKTAVADWLKRADLTSSIPTFVALAEANIRRDVRVRAMEQEATGTLTAVTLALPTRFLEARRVILGTTVQDYVVPNEWYPLREAGTNQYTILGESFHFQKLADYAIQYWQAFAAFSADGDTNWLITNAPDVYLWASLEQAAIFIRDDSMAALSRAQYASALARLNATEQRARFGGPLAVRPRLVA